VITQLSTLFEIGMQRSWKRYFSHSCCAKLRKSYQWMFMRQSN